MNNDPLWIFLLITNCFSNFQCVPIPNAKGTVTCFEGRFPQFIEEEEEKKPKPYNLYGFVDLMENEQVYAKNGFAPYRIPQPEGNHNGWQSEEEEAHSDSESTASVLTPVRVSIGHQKGYVPIEPSTDLICLYPVKPFAHRLVNPLHQEKVSSMGIDNMSTLCT
ncbi:hypothetical protein Tco_1563831 [Tanacetum coccineum]